MLFCAVTGSQDSSASAAAVKHITTDEVVRGARGTGRDDCDRSEDGTHRQRTRDQSIHKGLH